MGTNPQYDVIIVGAGPAGLSAARTTARLGFSTLVVEKSRSAGQLAHPCSAILGPVPGFVKGRRLLGDLFYPELDLLIPLSMVVGYPRLHRFISPGGFEVEAAFARGDGSPVAALDKGQLLQLMADQAEGAGTEFQFGTEAVDLIEDGGQIVGVRTAAGEIRGSVVMAAEGTSRRLSRAAGLFPQSKAGSPKGPRALIMTREYVAPRVRRQHLGQITTFGRSYTSAPAGFGTVVMPIAGRASVYFTLLLDGDGQIANAADYYLTEYVQQDPRVSELFAGSQVLSQAACTIAIKETPMRVTRPGFMSLGDAATPAGHVGILPAIWLGRKAALVAAEALDSDDLSASQLGLFGHLFHNRLLRVLRTERHLMMGLLEMPDADLDRLAQTLCGLPLAAPFFGGWSGIPWEAARWLARNYPDGTYQNGLLQRVLETSTQQPGHLETGSAGLWSMLSPSSVS